MMMRMMRADAPRWEMHGSRREIAKGDPSLKNAIFAVFGSVAY
jgi:hypothetical protein